MLTEEQISENKQEFISLIRKINREGALIEDLIKQLENSDFFVAPASTQFHCNYKGGLCKHSLNVYKELKSLVEIKYPENTCPIEEDSIIITGLLHDISKMNFYETSTRNVKDESGAWIQVPFIKIKEAKDRFIYATHGANSEYLVGRFIPLKLEESVAIINHMGGKEQGSNGFDSTMSEIFNKYPLAILLHSADMLATFFDERIL